MKPGCPRAIGFVVCGCLCWADALAQTWSRVYSGSQMESPAAIVQTSDQGFALLLAGIGSGSSLLRVDAAGSVQWRKAFPSGMFRGMDATSDGGFLLSGNTGPPGQDLWLVKVDAGGTVVWQRAYSGPSNDLGTTVRSTADGGSIVGGLTYFNPQLPSDAWVLKLDQDGNVQWEQRLGGEYTQTIRSIEQTAAGEYVLLSDTSVLSPGTGDFWLVGLGPSGGIQWQQAFGGAGGDSPVSATMTTGGALLAVGWTNSFSPSTDMWLVKLPPIVPSVGPVGGGGQFQRRYGGGGGDIPASMCKTSDGGVVVVGTTDSFGAGGEDIWALKISASGAVVWQRTYGGALADWGRAVVQTSDGGFVIAGDSFSFGTRGALLLRTDADGKIGGSCGLSRATGVMPINAPGEGETTSEGGLAVGPSIRSTTSQVAAATTTPTTLCGGGLMVPEGKLGGRRGNLLEAAPAR